MEKVEISKDLLQQILVFFWKDLEDYTGAGRDSYVDDASICKIFDGLLDEFSDESIENLFPDTYLKSYRSMAVLDRQRAEAKKEEE